MKAQRPRPQWRQSNGQFKISMKIRKKKKTINKDVLSHLNVSQNMVIHYISTTKQRIWMGSFSQKMMNFSFIVWKKERNYSSEYTLSSKISPKQKLDRHMCPSLDSMGTLKLDILDLSTDVICVTVSHVVWFQ